MITIEQKQEHLDFLNKILDSNLQYPNCVSVANLDANGGIMAVIGFYNFSKYSCDLAVACVNPKACSKAFLDVCFHYVFNTAKKARATCIASEDNKRSLKLIRGLGFSEEGRLKNMFGDKDGIIFGMTSSQNRWSRS